MLPIDRRRALAAELCVREQYLYQILRGLGVASPALARKIHSLEPSLHLQDLRPDDWRLIWPELAESEPKNPKAPAHQARVAIKSEAMEAANA